ncbi:ribosome recycling factor [Candidatus Shapirobacteria bacterium]|nr:MAG: ribosome recycling factor [Candidatus Shapirobacteria bacterium]
MIQEALVDAEKRMRSAIQSLEEDLAGVRTGRASPQLIEKLPVEYYGQPVPLVQLASISVPESRQLLIRPFDASADKEIVKAIMTSDLGLTPVSDGKNIRLTLPPLTEERRRELLKFVNHRLEEARIAVRNVRRDAIKDLREFEEKKLISEDELKRAEEDVQKLVDHISEEIDEIGKKKEQEIMEF